MAINNDCLPFPIVIVLYAHIWFIFLLINTTFLLAHVNPICTVFTPANLTVCRLRYVRRIHNNLLWTCPPIICAILLLNACENSNSHYMATKTVNSACCDCSINSSHYSWWCIHGWKLISLSTSANKKEEWNIHDWTQISIKANLRWHMTICLHSTEGFAESICSFSLV